MSDRGELLEHGFVPTYVAGKHKNADGSLDLLVKRLDRNHRAYAGSVERFMPYRFRSGHPTYAKLREPSSPHDRNGFIDFLMPDTYHVPFDKDQIGYVDYTDNISMGVILGQPVVANLPIELFFNKDDVASDKPLQHIIKVKYQILLRKTGFIAIRIRPQSVSEQPLRYIGTVMIVGRDSKEGWIDGNDPGRSLAHVDVKRLQHPPKNVRIYRGMKVRYAAVSEYGEIIRPVHIGPMH